MRLEGGRYVCAQCGVELSIRADEKPMVTMSAVGGQPNMRVLVLDGKEVHRCPYPQRSLAR